MWRGTRYDISCRGAHVTLAQGCITAAAPTEVDDVVCGVQLLRAPVDGTTCTLSDALARTHNGSPLCMELRTGGNQELETWCHRASRLVVGMSGISAPERRSFHLSLGTFLGGTVTLSECTGPFHVGLP